MRKKNHPIGCIGVILILLCLMPRCLFADSLAMNLFVDGVELYENHQYDTALKKIREALAITPDNLDMKYYLALILTQKRQYDDALDLFDTIVTKQPDTYYKGFFDAAAVCVQTGNNQKALVYLNRAEWQKPKDPRIFLEKGYVYQRLEKRREASACFNRAAELDPSLKQLVYYNIGLLFMAAKAYDKAVYLFENAHAVNPKSSLAKNALAALKAAKRSRKMASPLRLSAYFGLGYDDNIAHESDAVSVLQRQNGADKSDVYYTGAINVNFALLKSDRVRSTLGYRFESFDYDDSGWEDITGHTPFLFIESGLKGWTHSLRYDYGSYSADNEKRATTGSMVYRVFGNHSMTNTSEFSLHYISRSYHDNGTTPDSSAIRAEAIHSIRLNDRMPVFRLGYTFEKESSDYDPASYDLHSLVAGMLICYQNRLFIDIPVKGSHRYYDAFVSQGDRRDKEIDFFPSFAYVMNDFIEFRLIGHFIWNQSNVVDDTEPDHPYDPYQYQKSVVNLLIGLKY